MNVRRWKLHLSVALLAIGAMVVALTPAVADPVSNTEDYPDVAFLARNDVPFDAQTAASMAAQLGAPMFITAPDALSDPAADGIADLNPDVLIVAGGSVAVSAAVADEAAAQCDPNCTIDRRFGTGRDETAAALAGIAADYGFDRPVLQGTNHVAGDVHVDGTVSTNALTVEDTALVSGLNADRLDGKHADAFLGAGEKAADSELLDGKDSTEFLGAGEQATDSDKVDGFQANAISRVAYDSTDGTALNGIGGTAASATITAPTDGLLVLSGSLDLINTSTSDTVFCEFQDAAGTLNNTYSQSVDGSGSMTHTNMSLDSVEPVASGSHTVNIECADVGSDTRVLDPFLVVQFVPFGADGTQPTP